MEQKNNSQLKNKKLFWIEDDNLISEILGPKFINAGFILTHTATGEEGLKILEGDVPDAILVDLLLPGMSGFEIIKKVREQHKFDNVPVIVLSNLSKQSDIDTAYASGVQKFILKANSSVDQIISEVKDAVK